MNLTPTTVHLDISTGFMQRFARYIKSNGRTVEQFKKSNFKLQYIFKLIVLIIFLLLTYETFAQNVKITCTPVNNVSRPVTNLSACFDDFKIKIEVDNLVLSNLQSTNLLIDMPDGLINYSGSTFNFTNTTTGACVNIVGAGTLNDADGKASLSFPLDPNSCIIEGNYEFTFKMQNCNIYNSSNFDIDFSISNNTNQNITVTVVEPISLNNSPPNPTSTVPLSLSFDRPSLAMDISNPILSTLPNFTPSGTYLTYNDKA
jgi:hypothetical protein